MPFHRTVLLPRFTEIQWNLRAKNVEFFSISKLCNQDKRWWGDTHTHTQRFSIHEQSLVTVLLQGASTGTKLCCWCVVTLHKCGSIGSNSVPFISVRKAHISKMSCGLYSEKTPLFWKTVSLDNYSYNNSTAESIWAWDFGN